MATQLIVPNPDIPCRPGYCLEYVRETFALPIRYGSATEAWNNSASQHPDWNFPAGLAVPIWFDIDIEPNGHVALLMPDLTVYSASDLTNTPHHHPSIADLIAYYARWGKMQLTYLGWTEDVAGYPVVSLDAAGSINFQSVPNDPTPTPAPAEQDVFDIMTATPEEQDAFIQRFLDHLVTQADGNKASLGSLLQEYRQQHLDLVKQTTRPTINPSQAEDIVAAVTSRVPNAVLNAKFTLPDGTVTNLAGILSAINAKPATTGTVTNVAADPQAIADAIVNGLNIQIVKK